MVLWSVAATAMGIAVLALVSTSGRKVAAFSCCEIVVDGHPRTYRVVVPPSATNEQLPIVFAFHGHGNTPESEADRTKLDQLAAARGFVLVYPAALDGSWRTHALDESESAEENCDIRFFDALLDHLSVDLNVDRKRVYLVGMSMGATFVHDVALARSDKVAAALAHSSSPPPGIECERPFPIMMVIGANEPPYALQSARDGARRYREKGHICELLLVRGIGHEWAQGQNMRMWRFLARHRL
ncbi:MAG: dienelactone hydrolase family protein [Planctomycetes bacterium]|nr:dienelactone hydrolase family protein [Planctomycetota bacterium]